MDSEFEPFAHGATGKLEYIAGALGSHSVVAWIYLIDGAPQIVGLEFAPASSQDNSEVVRDLVKRMASMAETFETHPPAPLDRGSVRSLPYGAILEARLVLSEMGERSAGRPIALHRGEQTVALNFDELRMLEPLTDARIYAEALARGERNPTHAIAEYRRISIRTAQGRVARARELGLLTPARQGVASGQLTRIAEHLTRKMTTAAEILETGENDG